TCPQVRRPAKGLSAAEEFMPSRLGVMKKHLRCSRCPWSRELPAFSWLPVQGYLPDSRRRHPQREQEFTMLSRSSAELSSPGVAPEPTSATPQLQVIKRTGQAVAYDARKIAIAITKAFLAVEGQTASGSARVRETVDSLARDITARIRHRLPDGGTIHIEEIQDLVELGLMRQGCQKIARAYVLYREEHAKQRPLPTADLNHPEIKVLRADGTEAPLNLGRLQTLVDDACHGLDGVDAKRVLEASLKNLYSGVKAKDVNTAL